jgi:hypothetical protein
MKIADLTAALFPYRTHLEHEIDYLKAQLAQERRRVDVLLEKPKPVTAGGMIQAKKPISSPTPLGWDATRAERRHAERTQAVQAGPDTRSEDQASDHGAAVNQ